MTASERRATRMSPAHHALQIVVPPIVTLVPVDDRLAWAEETLAALDTLPTLQARVLELAYMNKLSYQEVADRLGVSIREATAAAAEGLRRLGEAIAVG